MKKTPLEKKEAIRELLSQSKPYEEIASILGISKRVARKWGQILKKRWMLESCDGSSSLWYLG